METTDSSLPPLRKPRPKAIRDANPGRVMFYTTDEILKEHPFTK